MTSLKEHYADDFEQARDLLAQAQARLASRTAKMDRKNIDTLMMACRNMPLRRPRGFASLIDACTLLDEICGRDKEVKVLLQQFWDIVDRINDRERVRKSLTLVKGEG